jgi:hypothetical protein
MVLAHAGHWFVGALYLLPVAILVGAFKLSSHRERRAERDRDE